MLFVMTQQDIDRGIPCNPYACPVVQTIERTLNVIRVSVRSEFIWIGGEHYPTPPNVAEFIDAIDDGLHRPPISFEVPVEVTS